MSKNVQDALRTECPFDEGDIVKRHHVKGVDFGVVTGSLRHGRCEVRVIDPGKEQSWDPIEIESADIEEIT